MKPILFSRTFPVYHPKRGQPTYFVEKIWAHLIYSGQYDFEMCQSYLDAPWAKDLFDTNKVSEFVQTRQFKMHTIRQGYSRSKDEIFSPRVWSGRPYTSKQIAFAPPLKILRVPMFFKDTLPDIGSVFLRNVQWLSDTYLQSIAQNDGLSLEDFQAWFKEPTFSGQIIYF